MKVIAAFFFLLAFSFNAIGGEQEDKKLAIEYLKVSRIESIIEAAINAYDQQLFRSLPPADRERAITLMRETMGWDVLKDQLAELVVSTYTARELKAAIAFMKTPVGASYTAKGDSFSTQLANLFSNNLQKLIREQPIQHSPVVTPGAGQ